MGNNMVHDNPTQFSLVRNKKGVNYIKVSLPLKNEINKTKNK